MDYFKAVPFWQMLKTSKERTLKIIFVPCRHRTLVLNVLEKVVFEESFVIDMESLEAVLGEKTEGFMREIPRENQRGCRNPIRSNRRPP